MVLTKNAVSLCTGQVVMIESGPRSDALKTRSEIARTYFAAGSPRILVAVSSVLLVWRFSLGRWGWADGLMALSTLALTGLVEWVIHRFLLHAPDQSFRMRRLKTGVGHRQHHLEPTSLGWILLHPVDATVFLVLFSGFTATWSLPLLSVAGQPLLPGFASAYTLAALGLAHYEWVHLLVHTRYRPSSRFYSRLARNHRLHHYRNEDYWLGVTSNSGDRLLRTLPADKTDVPLSETARTLN